MRIGAIDGLRGLAAITVAIFFHYRHFNVADAIVDMPLLMAIPFRWWNAMVGSASTYFSYSAATS